MQLVKRSAVLLAAFAISILSSLTDTRAQAPDCFGLRQADCKIVSTADANLAKLTTFAYELDVALAYDSGEYGGEYKLKGNGMYEGNLIGTATMAEMTAALKNLKFTLEASGSVANRMPRSSSTNEFDVQIIIVDGMVYENSTYTYGWQVRPLSNMLTSFDTVATPDPVITRALAQLPKIKGMIKARRTGAAPILEKQRQIEFVYTFDINVLLKSPELRPVLRELLERSGSNIEYSDRDIQNIASILSQALTGTTMKVTRWVGSKDNLYHALTLDFVLAANPKTFGYAIQPVVKGNLHFDIKLTGIGQPVDVTVPEEALPSPTWTPRPTRTPRPTHTPSRTPTARPTITPSATPTRVVPTATAQPTATPISGTF
jgi:hypothetical protein